MVTAGAWRWRQMEKILALAIAMPANIGAHPVSYVPLSNAYGSPPTVYDIPVATVAIPRALTNTADGAVSRAGAPRPRSSSTAPRYAARRLRMDRIALRRRNLIRRAQLPYRSATGLVYDSGNFRANMTARSSSADWNVLSGRRREAKKRGKLAGIGMANYVESPVGHPSEYVRLTVHAGRQVEP